MASGAAGAPKRVVFFFGGIGAVSQFYPASGSSDPVASQVLAPLEPYKDQILTWNGLGHNYQRGSHAEGLQQWLTGMRLAGKDRSSGAGGRSFDLRLADHIMSRPGAPPIGRLYLGCDEGRYMGPIGRVSWVGRGKAAEIEASPTNAYKSLFGNLTAPPASPTALSLTSSVSAPIYDNRKQSVLDHTKDDIRELQGKLGAAEREKLESHLDGIRQMERLIAPPRAPGPVEPTPSMPGMPSPPGSAMCVKPKVGSASNLADRGAMQTQVLLNALRCDLTRVGVLQWTGHSNGICHTWLEDEIPGIGKWMHHDISHENGGDTGNLGIPNPRAMNIAILRWYAKQFAVLVKGLRETPEIDGNGNMLDNTLIVWGMEINTGTQHGLENIPIVMAGKLGGAVRPGRYVQQKGMVNQIYASIAEAFGMPAPDFGGSTASPLTDI